MTILSADEIGQCFGALGVDLTATRLDIARRIESAILAKLEQNSPEEVKDALAEIDRSEPCSDDEVWPLVIILTRRVRLLEAKVRYAEHSAKEANEVCLSWMEKVQEGKP